MSIVWSPGVTKALLEKIKHREVLWDTNHRFFNKKNLKRSCFDQICMELKSENKHLHTLTTDDVVQRFQYLRGHFQKLLRKIKNTPNGSGGQAPSKWEFFNACLFMQPIYDNGHTQSSYLHSDDMMETPGDTIVVYEGLLEKDMAGNDVRASPSPSTSTSSPSPLPDLPEEVGPPTFVKASTSSTPSPLPDLPETQPEAKRMKRKRMDREEMEENLMESINCMKAAWASQSRVHGKPFRYDMATEAVMSVMELLSPHKDLKMEFTVEVLSLINRTVQKVQEREIREQNKHNQSL